MATLPAERPLWKICLLFIGAFALMQWAWNNARGSAIENLVVHSATVVPATFLINHITPEANAKAQGAHIVAPGGGLNIMAGCEGTEVLFLLVAAFVAVPLGWRQRLAGVALGMVGTFILTQARIVTLFYAFRLNRAWFDVLHTLVLPAALIAIVGFYFYAFCRHLRPLA